MKIAVRMYFAERPHYRPAMLELKSLHNVLNSMEHTAIYTDSGPRSPKTKYHNHKHLRLTYNETHLTVASQQTFTFDNCVQKHQLNNLCNGVLITTVQTLQGDVTANQILTP